MSTRLTYHGAASYEIVSPTHTILIDPFLSDNPSWDKGWNGNRAGEDSTQGGGR